jgi:hypothetical protein
VTPFPVLGAATVAIDRARRREQAIDALLAEAGLWVGKVTEPQPNAGHPMIDFANLRTVGELGLAWCASFVYLTGRMAVGSAWPAPRTARVQEVVEWAIRHDILERTPARGDLAVFWYESLARYAHIGLVESVSDDGVRFVSIEGNTNNGESREGWGVLRHGRTVTPAVKFVRWTAVLP